MKTFLITILALLLLSVSAMAAENVEFLQDSVSLTGLPGTVQSETVEINSSGDEAINVTFSGLTLNSGTNTFNLTGIGDEIDMLPDETRAFDIEADIPIDQIAGVYTGTVTATTEEGASDTLAIDLTVEATTDGLVLFTGPDDGESTPDTTVTATFEVENERNEEITATTGGTLSSNGDTLDVTVKSIVFAPFETKNVSVEISVPAGQPAGTYSGDIELTYDGLLAVSYTLVILESAEFTASDTSMFLFPGEMANTTMTLTKVGNIDVTGINATYDIAALIDSNGDRITLKFYPETIDLTDTTAIVTVEADSSARINAGNYQTTVTFESEEGTVATATFSIEIESILVISDVDLTSDGADDEVKPGEELTIDIEVENIDEDIDLEDIEITVRFRRGSRYLEDDDGDDIEEEIDEFDLDADDKETVSITITMPFEDFDDGDEYIIEITAEGRNADDRRQIFTTVDESEIIEFVKESHEIKFTEVNLGPDTLRCSRRAALDIGVQNIGRKDEDVQLVIKSDALDLYILRTFEVDKDPDDSDNEWDDTIHFDVDEDIEEGSYVILIEAYYDDGDESIRRIPTLSVKACTTPSGNGGNGQQEEEGEIEILPPTPTPSPVPPTSVEQKSSSTSGYVIALSILFLALIVLVVWLGTYALKKR